jgi:hypothetical protein
MIESVGEYSLERGEMIMYTVEGEMTICSLLEA